MVLVVFHGLNGQNNEGRSQFDKMIYEQRKNDVVPWQGETARCRWKFRYVSNFTTASCGFSATTRLSCWSLSADCSELSVKKWQVLERTSQITHL